MAEFSDQEGSSHNEPKSIEDLCARVQKFYPQADVALLSKAYYFSEKAHQGQIRRSGEPYIFHPLSVAGILVDLRLDLDTIITGLLHDTVEDTTVTLEDVKREFGETITALVDGVTKISRMSFKNTQEKQGENVRKMIVAMGKDVRVILVKLADRLHNMRTLNHMPYEKQARIALETLEIYAPLASRLGINSVKIELEDLAFRYYRPDMFYELSQKIQKKQKERDHYIDDVINTIQQEVEKHGHKKFDVMGRSKHLWSIYRKMESRNLDYEQVYDILAFRVLVDTLGECYEVLGLIHSLWKPIPGRFKDFIAMPKANNYQSLHTTVVGPGGERIEIQIRTREMHLIAERGIAAHWRYKERGTIAEETADQFEWLKDLVSHHQKVNNPEEFLDSVKSDLFDVEIYVFTPKGDVRELPEGATPIDFAYGIHTDVGNKCTGARVNGKIVPIKYELQNGDTVEILTSKNQTPSKDWLKFCVTTKAKSKIRWFVKEEQRKRSLVLGKELVEKEFRKNGSSFAKYLKSEELEKFIKDMGVADVDEYFIRVGYGKMEPRHLVERLVPAHPAGAENQTASKAEDNSVMQQIVKAASQKSRKTGTLVLVEGMDDVVVHFARCCHPIPGDPILGFITRGRGITVHRADCKRSFEQDQLRRVDVNWASKTAAEGMERIVRIRILSTDVPGLLKLMGEAFSVHGINIQNAQIRTTKDKKAVSLFDVSVKDTSQLNNAIFDLQKIKGIIGVTRLTGTS